ncbi:MAG: hypothetical protein H6R19_3104 [Proteobacteria bacterium]|nr:hypothetical protein [Pseudomonadota bacterium]
MPERDTPLHAQIAVLPLLVGIVIMLAISIRPDLLADSAGRADHTAAMLMCCAMAAGFVRGVGFVPRWWLWRGLFSSAACALFLALTLWRLLG